jgi:thiol-disulfide isomerase/thioredoxin
MKTLAFVFACFAASAALAASSAPSVGQPAPDFTAVKADNTQVKLSDFRGKVVLVDFWATWCGPCKETMPHLEALHKKLAGQGLVILGVCVMDERKNFDTWMKKPGVSTTYLKAFDPAARNANKSIAVNNYNVESIPAFFLLDREGKVVFTDGGSSEATAKKLEAELSKLGLKL